MKRVKPEARLAALLLAAAGLLLAAGPSFAAAAQVIHSKDTVIWVFRSWMGGAGGTGPEYFWVELSPNTVIKEFKDGSVFWQDCDNSATITIGTGDDPWAAPTEIHYTGRASFVDQGTWVLLDDGWWWPGERMNWHLKATVFDSEGNEWELFWQYVKRGGEVIETT